MSEEMPDRIWISNQRHPRAGGTWFIQTPASYNRRFNTSFVRSTPEREAAGVLREALQEARTFCARAIFANVTDLGFDPKEHPTIAKIDSALALADKGEGNG